MANDDLTPDGRMQNASFRLSQEALRALKAGNHVEAIRLVREATGTGLAEAKTIVAALEKGVPKAAARAARQSLANAVRPSPASPELRSGPGLAPGEVPHVGGQGKWLVLFAVAVVLIAAALYY
jgi:hypothetical protein